MLLAFAQSYRYKSQLHADIGPQAGLEAIILVVFRFQDKDNVAIRLN